MYNLEKATEFLDKIDEPYALIFDKDSDGICSASLIYKYLKQKGVEPGLATCKDESGINISKGLWKDASKFKFVIFLDMPMDQSPYADNLPGENVLIVDHHAPQKDLNSENIIHINPRFTDPDKNRPTSWLAYRITESLNKKYIWIGGAGTVADYGVKDNPDIFDEIHESMPETLVEDYHNQKEMWSSGLGMVTNIISSAFGTHSIEGARESFDVLKDAEEPSDVSASNLMKYYEDYQGELERIKNEFRSKAKHFPSTNAYMMRIESKYKVSSVVATLIAEENPDAVVILYRETAHRLELSMRCQTGRINVADLAKEITKDIGRGGGHPQAAGAEILIDNKDEFFHRIEARLSGL